MSAPEQPAVEDAVKAAVGAMRHKYPLVDYLLANAKHNVDGVVCSWGGKGGIAEIPWETLLLVADSLEDVPKAIEDLCLRLRQHFVETITQIPRASSLNDPNPKASYGGLPIARWRFPGRSYKETLDLDVGNSLAAETVLAHPGTVVPQDYFGTLLTDPLVPKGIYWVWSTPLAVRLYSMQDGMFKPTLLFDDRIEIDAYYQFAWLDPRITEVEARSRIRPKQPQPLGKCSEVTLASILSDALDGSRGEDQQRIASIGLRWLCSLLAKNADYGSSVWKSPTLCPGLRPGDAIFVRMTDKIERLVTLRTQDPEVADETLEDTVGDLGAYCLLWLARPDASHATTKGTQ